MSTSATQASWSPAWHLISLVLGISSSFSCADALGLRRAQLEGACRAAEDCAPGSSCVETRCLTSACAINEAPRCSGLVVQECTANASWQDHARPCPERCLDGRCQGAPSCAVNSFCEGEVSCCHSLVVPTSDFSLTYYVNSDDGEQNERLPLSVQRHVTRFALDKFEVTVGRFREFYATFDHAKSLLVDGAGAPPTHLDLGWESAWNDDVTIVPGDAESLRSSVIVAQDLAAPTIDADLPVRGVSWYMAQAFCIWDKGRLPTEAEWALAATGAEQRTYPWPDDDGLPAIDANRARFASDERGPSRVGTHHQGVAAFGHEDMGGNAAEWVSDVYSAKLVESCPSGDLHPNDCVQAGTGWLRVLRGGAYASQEFQLKNANRSASDARDNVPTIGFRCARDL